MNTSKYVIFTFLMLLQFIYLTIVSSCCNTTWHGMPDYTHPTPLFKHLFATRSRIVIYFVLIWFLSSTEPMRLIYELHCCYFRLALWLSTRRMGKLSFCAVFSHPLQSLPNNILFIQISTLIFLGIFITFQL